MISPKLKVKKMQKKLSAIALMTLLPTLAAAHEGHGMEGAHWHATDVWGFVVAGLVAAALFWYIRRK